MEIEMTTATIINKITGEVIETINNVVAIWNNSRTVESNEWGEAVFTHLEEGEVLD